MERESSSSAAVLEPASGAEVTAIRASGFVPRPRRGPGSYDRSLSAAARHEEQRLTLIDAAAHIFARYGYANAAVASILDASGLSRGTFYRHFGDIEAALSAVQENAGDVLLARLSTAVRRHAEPEVQLRAGIRAYLEHCAERGDLARVFHREAIAASEPHSAYRRQCVAVVQRALRAALASAVSGGLILSMPDDATIIGVMTAIEGVALRYLSDHRESELIDALDSLHRLAVRALT
jgi:AcrR family transcriptional regulator